MGRPSNTAERRGQIVAALRRVMARAGYDGASIADVAREAGLTPGLVHYHFASKQDVLLALVDGLLAEHAARLEVRLAAAGDDPRARLGAFLDSHLATGEGADPDALACWVTLTAEALRQPEVARRVAAGLGGLVDRLAEIVREGARRRRFRAADPRVAAAALVAAIQGYFVLAATARELIPRRSAAGATRRMAEGLLGRAPRERRSS